jgi:beta-lactamase class D
MNAMKRLVWFCWFFLVLSLASCSSSSRPLKASFLLPNETLGLHSEFQPYFAACGIDGTFVMYDARNGKWEMSDTTFSKVATLPASTFKIVNLLIALETRAVLDENEIVKWTSAYVDTLKYGHRPEIYHDMTVAEAFEVSAGWVFVELANRVGKENYKKYLLLSQYGNGNLNQPDVDFWNFGAFGISPIDQVKFLRRFYEGKLPFKKHHIEIVKKVMRTEKIGEYTLKSKTGWTRHGGINTGWWVGYVEHQREVSFFAIRLLQDRKFNSPNFGSCRMKIAKTILKDLKKIP